jgi:pimeloyl-ACP methyl ester carboxylesterase
VLRQTLDDGWRVGPLQPVEGIVGLAAAAAGNWDVADAHFRSALAFVEGLGDRLGKPSVQRWHAWMLLRRDAPGDRDRARALLADGQAKTAREHRPPSESLERLRGRYLRLSGASLDQTWVFEESAGDADKPVMLMLHTAGADSRQWHGLMSDEGLLRDWRLVAFDMPFHGRSSPPLHWSGEPPRLDAAGYLAVIDAWFEAAGIDRALIVGCSMGAAAGLALLAELPARAYGAVLLEAPFRSPGRRSDFLDHPAVHGGRFSAAWVQALLSPASPPEWRRRATWIYSQGGPGVYEGDLAFYSDEFDAQHYVGRIDTRKTPLWLLTGEYDYSATPADSQRIADAVPGAVFRTMDGLGHFPMTENPAALLEHLRQHGAADDEGCARVEAQHEVPGL